METRISLVTWAIAGLALAALATAACGVANPFAPAPSANKDRQQQLLKYTQCMRQHGINMSDPGTNGSLQIQRNAPAPAGSTPGSGSSSSDSGATSGGGAGTGGPGPETSGNDPQLQAAQSACQKYLPNGGQGSPPSQAQIDALTKYTQCMREHGIPMSDPQVSGNRVSVGFNNNGTNKIDPNSTQFQDAQKACQHFMPGGAPGGQKVGG